MTASETERANSNWARVALIALLLLLLPATYVGSYFLVAGEPTEFFMSGGVGHYRVFKSAAAAKFYKPVAWVECRIRGQEFALLIDDYRE